MFSRNFIPFFEKAIVGLYQREYVEIESSLPVYVLQLLFFGAGDVKKSVFSLYACLNIYHMFEFRHEQHLLKLT